MTEGLKIDPKAPTEPAQVPLCVDLDGTLIRSDLLWESTVILLCEKPWLVFALPFWLLKGRAWLKREILRHVRVPVDSLPYNLELLAWLADEKAMGRTLVLATASEQSVAAQVAAHVGLFDLVLASDGERNLKGVTKLKELKARYGKHFDYVGNSRADLPIWRECRYAVIVDAPTAVVQTARKTGNVQSILASQTSRLPLIIRQIRLHQWVKNLLVFVPLLTSHQFTSLQLVWRAAAAFIAFGMVASSVYVLNDLLDLESDRKHPRKRLRPFASGKLSLAWAFLLGPGFLLLGFGLAATLIPSALPVLAAYFALTCLYSYWLKSILLLDVFSLAALYTIRIIMGGAAYHVDLSVWLLSFSMFLFLSLGFAKRSAELYNQVKSYSTLNKRRAYDPSDLPQVNIFGITSGFASSLVLTLYMNSANMRALYSNPDLLWLLFPLLLYWVSRIWILTTRGEMDEDPILFALKDRTTLLVAFCFVLVTFLATRNWIHLF